MELRPCYTKKKEPYLYSKRTLEVFEKCILKNNIHKNKKDEELFMYQNDGISYDVFNHEYNYEEYKDYIMNYDSYQQLTQKFQNEMSIEPFELIIYNVELDDEMPSEEEN
jgi:hypothetical protein